MHRSSQPTLRQRIATSWLVVIVHLDAFRMFPARYLTAAKWRILGKRVRARAQLAPLLSHSPRAYELLAAREAGRVPPLGDTAALHSLLALVQPGDDPAELAATLQSCADAGVAHVLLTGTGPGSLADATAATDPGTNSWVMPLRAGDRLTPWAGQAYAAAIAEADPGCSVIYADDDLWDRRGRPASPHFKPDWNSELWQHHDFLTGACIVRAGAPDLAAAAHHPDWAAALVRAATARGSVTHLRRVLHHRRSRPVASARVPALAPAQRLPLVSVVIPTRNRAELLRTCIDGLRATDYPAMEIIVANNGSDEPETLDYLAALAKQGVTILDQPGPFNYPAINNNAVAVAKGELLCLMNNDIEVLSPDWLAIMATQAMREEVGAVGAQLLYPDGRIQHAGVVIGVGNAAGHAHRFLTPEAEGYFRRHALPQYISAVTAACLVVRRDRFVAVGGLDAANFPVAFNDVDLCLKLNARGWQSFYEPRAVLVHHESVSRGHDTDPVGAARFAGELAALQRIWHTDKIVDPYHHPKLSRASEQFALDLGASIVRR